MYPKVSKYFSISIMIFLLRSVIFFSSDMRDYVSAFIFVRLISNILNLYLNNVYNLFCMSVHPQIVH